jgi:hypothetical protein
VAPTMLEEYAPSEAPSEAESSRSVPPKMVLHWNDGRPDMPIPFVDPKTLGRPSRRQAKSPLRLQTTGPPLNIPSIPSEHHSVPRNRGRSGSSPLARSPRPISPMAPEEIRVLPSNHESPASSRPNHQRSKSLPRSTDAHSHRPASPGPPLPGPMPFPHGPPQTTKDIPLTWHNYERGPHQHHHIPKSPPAIVYAPSHSRAQPRYAPPVLLSHPPQYGPDGVVYSHSAPAAISSRYQGLNDSGFPSTMIPPSHTIAAFHEAETRAGTWSGGTTKGRRVPPPLPLARPPSVASLNSQGSGSTYYVLPSAGQKVHVIMPSPESSIATATSATRYPSPTSPRSIRKPPFLQRLWNFAGKFSSSGSTKAPSVTGSRSSGSRRLQRRHSIGSGSARSQPHAHH